MKKNPEAKRLFNDNTEDKLVPLITLMLAFPYKDPFNPPNLEEIREAFRGPEPTYKEYYAEDYDVNSPKTKYRSVWQQYLSVAIIHGRASNKKATNFFDTRSERHKYVSWMRSYLGRNPNSKDLQEAFPYISSFDDDLLTAIDADLETF